MERIAYVIRDKKNDMFFSGTATLVDFKDCRIFSKKNHASASLTQYTSTRGYNRLQRNPDDYEVVPVTIRTTVKMPD